MSQRFAFFKVFLHVESGMFAVTCDRCSRELSLPDPMRHADLAMIIMRHADECDDGAWK